MKNEKAFTLIELLVVIVILGIILSITISSVGNFIYDRGNKMYNAHIKILEKKADLFTLKFRGEFNSYPDATCFKVPYSRFVNEGLLEEDEITCTGNIMMKRNNNSYDYTYYLTCKDKNGDSVGKSPGTFPSGCITLN